MQNETPEDKELRELEAQARAAREGMQAKYDASERAIRVMRAREEIKLAELDATLGVRGRDYVPIFDPKTGAMVVVKTPTEVATQAYQAVVLGDSPTGMQVIEASTNYVMSSLVYPDKAAFGKLCSQTPGFMDGALGVCSQLAGVDTRDVVGKAKR